MPVIRLPCVAAAMAPVHLTGADSTREVVPCRGVLIGTARSQEVPTDGRLHQAGWL